jgi:CHASE2 domain-containing sensor protein
MNSSLPLKTANATPAVWEAFWGHLLPHGPLRWGLLLNPFISVCAISFFVYMLEGSWIVAEMQDWSLDWFLTDKHKGEHDCSKGVGADCSKDVVIVAINDADYRDHYLFDSKSPLEPDKVLALLYAVMAQRPKIVGVDLDTKDTPWFEVIKDLSCTKDGDRRDFSIAPVQHPNSGEIHTPPNPRAADRLSCLCPSEPKVVWARMPAEPKGKPEDRTDKPIQLYQLFGGYGSSKEWDACSGVPRFPMDPDGVVRKYAGEVETDGEGPKKSFSRTIAENFPDRVRNDTNLKEERIINFAHRRAFRGWDEWQELVRKQAKDSAMTKSYSFHKVTDVLSGKIVLIGGEFEDARDSYPSPGRHGSFFLIPPPPPEPISGIELNAQAIESDLDPKMTPIKELHCLLPLFADIVMGILLVGIFWFILDYLPTLSWFVSHHFDKLRVLLFVGATALTVVVAIFSSWVLFKFSFWMSFIPILIGANIHQYIEHAKAVGREKRL